MGLEVLSKISQLLSWFTAIKTNAELLALAGFIIIGVVGVIYAVRGLMILGRWLINLRVREFTIALVCLGALLIVIAVLIP